VAPSLDLSVQLHRLDDLSDWLLIHGTAPIADRGLIGFRSEVWSADGRQVASGGGQLLSRAVPPPSG
jgi:acyl-CoA thioesterase